MKKYSSVEEYMLDFPETTQNKMQDLREIIASVAIESGEGISPSPSHGTVREDLPSHGSSC